MLHYLFNIVLREGACTDDEIAEASVLGIAKDKLVFICCFVNAFNCDDIIAGLQLPEIFDFCVDGPHDLGLLGFIIFITLILQDVGFNSKSSTFPFFSPKVCW